jgi:hypothetical protein
MNTTHIAEVVKMLLAVNVAAMIILAVMSYVSSIFILNWLESLDRWLSAPDRNRGKSALKKTPHEVSERTAP